MSLKGLFGKAAKAAKSIGAVSGMAKGKDGAKVLREKFTVVIKQVVRAEDRQSVEAAIEALEVKLQQIGGLSPLMDMCEFEAPVIPDGLPEVTIMPKE